jgi:AraC family transcriptional activator of pyochelin receptor
VHAYTIGHLNVAIRPKPLLTGRHMGESNNSTPLSDLADLLIAPRPLLGRDGKEIKALVEALERAQPGADGLRQYLPADEGLGSWTFYPQASGIALSATDASYLSDHWLDVRGEGYLKLRVLLSGELRTRDGAVLVEGPGALVYSSPGESREGYLITGNRPLLMVAIHARAAALLDHLGLHPGVLPPPFDALTDSAQPATHLRFAPGAEMLRAAGRILAVRAEVPAGLRLPLVRSLGLQLLAEAVAGLRAQHSPPVARPGLKPRHAALAEDAGQYLAEHYVRPPSIRELSRMLGLSETRLKSAFVACTGETIGACVTRLRMTAAARLLAERDVSIAQVGYAVGYTHPASFTQAFRRYHGCRPRDWRATRRP